MPIHLNCPNGHALRVKDRLAGQSGACPTCGAGFVVPVASPATREPSSADAGPPTPSAPVPPATGDSADAAVEWRVALPDGSQFGPTVAIIFSQWIAAGRVPPEALVWRTGWADWRRAEDAQGELPAPLPGGIPAPAAPPLPTVPRGATLPPTAATPAPVVGPDRDQKSISGVSYSLRKKREARRRRRFIIGLAVVCLALTAMLLGMVLMGPPANAPVVPR